jgi:cell division inhibitor SepF
MAGVFQKAMVWLGLAPDDEYDDYPYEGPVRQGPGPGPSRQAAPSGQGYGQQYGAPQVPVGRPPAGGARGPARQPRPAPEPEDDPFSAPSASGRPSGAVRQLPARGALQNDPRSVRGQETPTVRPMRPTSAKPSTIAPESFDDAKDIADRFKASQPVVMDLASLDRELARRLIDFASGICYALGGHMERVRPGAYLLTPVDVEVSDDEKRRLASAGR